MQISTNYYTNNYSYRFNTKQKNNSIPQFKANLKQISFATGAINLGLAGYIDKQSKKSTDHYMEEYGMTKAQYEADIAKHAENKGNKFYHSGLQREVESIDPTDTDYRVEYPDCIKYIYPLFSREMRPDGSQIIYYRNKFNGEEKDVMLQERTPDGKVTTFAKKPSTESCKAEVQSNSPSGTIDIEFTNDGRIIRTYFEPAPREYICREETLLNGVIVESYIGDRRSSSIHKPIVQTIKFPNGITLGTTFINKDDSFYVYKDHNYAGTVHITKNADGSYQISPCSPLKYNIDCNDLNRQLAFQKY